MTRDAKEFLVIDRTHEDIQVHSKLSIEFENNFYYSFIWVLKIHCRMSMVPFVDQYMALLALLILYLDHI